MGKRIAVRVSVAFHHHNAKPWQRCTIMLGWFETFQQVMQRVSQQQGACSAGIPQGKISTLAVDAKASRAAGNVTQGPNAPSCATIAGTALSATLCTGKFIQLRGGKKTAGFVAGGRCIRSIHAEAGVYASSSSISTTFESITLRPL